ncbi:MAG: DNA adenine methylase [Nocardioides sp.]
MTSTRTTSSSNGRAGCRNRVRPPMPYSGGKQGIAHRIADTFPPHDHYLEPYAGALSVLLAKPPAPMETVSDLNGDLICFWRTLRDSPEQLARACALTPHSRAEHLASRDLTTGHDGSPIDDLERARRVWVQLAQGRGSRLGTRTGWRFVHGTNRMPLAKYLDGYHHRIAPAAARLHSVSLESRPAVDLITAYQRPGALIYADPPYLAEVRHGRQYAVEMTTLAEHEELLELLVSSPAMVAVSGYDHPLYHQHLEGWTVHRFAATNMRGNHRTEVLWTNYQTQPALFTLDHQEQEPGP